MNLIYSTSYNGYKVYTAKGPLIENILIKNERVLSKALDYHPRTCLLRFELKFPCSYMGSPEVISKFFNAFRDRIKVDLTSKSANRNRRIHSHLGYIWVKECSGQHGWHYHVAVLVNYDVYNCFGAINSQNKNMYQRIEASWASALGIAQIDAKGLVHLPGNCVYKLDTNSVNYLDDIQGVLFRLSYFAKVDTKPYGDVSSRRFYGTSDIS